MNKPESTDTRKPLIVLPSRTYIHSVLMARSAEIKKSMNAGSESKGS